MIGMFKHLLPTGKAWRLTTDKQLRQFFEGLSWLQTDVKSYTDSAFVSMYPQETQTLDELEAEYGYLPGLLTEQERRDRLSARMASEGGQSPKYLQDTLQAAGFDVYVHEWWADPTPTPRDPNQYLADANTVSIGPDCGETLAECGEPLMECGNVSTPTGRILVNPSFNTVRDEVALCGEPVMECGEAAAECGEFTGYIQDIERVTIPTGEGVWPYFLYIGGEVFPDNAQITPARRDEFETLCLRICPTHLWIGLLVTYQ